MKAPSRKPASYQAPPVRHAERCPHCGKRYVNIDAHLAKHLVREGAA